MTLDDIKARCDEVGDCWLWKGAMQGGSVPAMRIPGRLDSKKTVVSVRRWIAVHQGRSTVGVIATPSCQDRRCVCPDHIQLITRKVLSVRVGKTIIRNQTYARKAAYINARIKAGLAKIGFDRAKAIRESERSPQSWADEIGCDVSAIHRAKNGSSYKDYSSPFAGLMG